MTQAVIATTDVIQVHRWPSERPLLVLVLLAAIAVWAALAVSLIGIVYVALIGAFFFVAHLVFITHLRGNAVRLGPDQMPEVYRRVEEIAGRLGMKNVPEAYVVQQGGLLNALATKFMRSNFIVLFSDLLEACGDNTEARDFIVAHELGHLKAGHLRGRWLLLPGLAIPFLGSAYSRACEYTSDRYGIAVAGDRQAALDGLCILAAGGEQGPRVNRRALVAQRRDLNTSWMRLGHWLHSHPAIAYRLAALDPNLAEGSLSGVRATAGALIVVILAIAVPTAAAVGGWRYVRDVLQQAEQAAAPAAPMSEVELQQRVQQDILALVDAVETYRSERGSLPRDADDLYAYWAVTHPKSQEPIDPYDGNRYGYDAEGGKFIIWSTGPDIGDDADDVYYSSALAQE